MSSEDPQLSGEQGFEAQQAAVAQQQMQQMQQMRQMQMQMQQMQNASNGLLGTALPAWGRPVASTCSMPAAAGRAMVPCTPTSRCPRRATPPLGAG